MFPFSIYSNGTILLKLNWYEINRIIRKERIDVLLNSVLEELKEDVIQSVSREQLSDSETRTNIENFKDGIESAKKIFLKIKNLKL